MKHPTEDELRLFWADSANYDKNWDERGALAATMIRGDEQIILEIGCGPRQSLRQFIPEDCRYIAADMVAWSEDVIACDLNHGLLPEPLGQAQVCVMLGVLEYLSDVETALRSVSERCPVPVFSYCTTDASPERWHMWSNAYSSGGIFSILKRLRLAVDEWRVFSPGQYLLRVSRFD